MEDDGQAPMPEWLRTALSGATTGFHDHELGRQWQQAKEHLAEHAPGLTDHELATRLQQAKEEFVEKLGIAGLSERIGPNSTQRFDFGKLMAERSQELGGQVASIQTALAEAPSAEEVSRQAVARGQVLQGEVADRLSGALTVLSQRSESMWQNITSAAPSQSPDKVWGAWLKPEASAWWNPGVLFQADADEEASHARKERKASKKTKKKKNSSEAKEEAGAELEELEEADDFARVLLELSVHLADGSDVMCSLRTDDSRKDVAANFVRQHNLDPALKVPLRSLLKHAVANADTLPVELEVDVATISERAQQLAAEAAKREAPCVE